MKMEYRFEIPPELNLEQRLCPSIHGGMCKEPDVIYLYGWGTNDEYEVEIWSGLITHEHLHDLLHKNNIDVDLHHEIIYKMKPYIFSFRVGE